MNRYNYSKADVDAAIRGEPKNFMKKFDFEIKKNKLWYEGKFVVPNEERDAYLRKALYENKSTKSFGRDSLFYQIKKEVINISRRHILKFLKKQDVIVKRTARPKKEHRKFVLTVKRAGILSGDLATIRKEDLPSEYMPDRQQHDKDTEYNPEDDDVDVGKVFKGVRNDRHFYNLVDIYTGYLVTEVVGTKDENVVAAATKRLVDRMSKALKTPVREIQFDMGTEFNKSVKDLQARKIRTKRMRTNASVEARNAVLQRIFYTIVAQKRAGFASSVNQAVNIANETLNRKIGMTPNEAVASLQKGETIKRREGKHPRPIMRNKAYKKGDLVRRLVHKREKQPKGFKTYKGEHYGPVQKITKVKHFQGYPKYELDGVSKKKTNTPGEFVSMIKWHDELVPVGEIDKKSEDLVKKRKVRIYAPFRVGDLVWYTGKKAVYNAKVKKVDGAISIIYKADGVIRALVVDEGELDSRVYKKDMLGMYKGKKAKLKSIDPYVIFFRGESGKIRSLEIQKKEITPRK
mgnify:CR=1 FL=1